MFVDCAHMVCSGHCTLLWPTGVPQEVQGTRPLSRAMPDVCLGSAGTCPSCPLWLLSGPSKQVGRGPALPRDPEEVGLLPASASPACVGPYRATWLTEEVGGGWGNRGPFLPCPRASKVTIDSCSPQPSSLSYQLKHFRLQAKKPKSILKKIFKDQNTNSSEGLQRGQR